MNLVDELLGGLVEAGGHTTIEPGGRSWLIVVRKPDRMRLTPAGEEPRLRLREVLLGEREADPRTAALAGLVSACGLVKLQVPKDARRAAQERAAALAEGQAVPGAVGEAIAAAQRATASATLGAQGSIQ